MPKPAILVVDDDAQVLRALERDMRRNYGSAYRVVGSDSADAALDALRQLTLRGEPVALILSDQRMPRVTGIEFLEQAMTIYPDAKRALLTAYADTEAAIRAINTVRVDYYLLKPWEPPEEQLYPIVDDLLDDWQAAYRPTFEGIRVIGHRWSAEGHQIKDFLARNRVPYRWYGCRSRRRGAAPDRARRSRPRAIAACAFSRRHKADPTVDRGARRQGRVTDAGGDAVLRPDHRRRGAGRPGRRGVRRLRGP